MSKGFLVATKEWVRHKFGSFKATTEQTLGYECKNLLPYPYLETTHTDKGITWTDNGDGTVTANGTNTSTTQNLFDCFVRTVGTSKPFILPKGKYTFNGCPSGGSTSTYYVQVGITENNAWKVLGFDVGNGTTFELVEETQVQVQLGIKAGVTVNNLTFKPMLRRAEITDDTWEPYRPSVDKRINDNTLHHTQINVASMNLIWYQYGKKYYATIGNVKDLIDTKAVGRMVCLGDFSEMQGTYQPAIHNNVIFLISDVQSLPTKLTINVLYQIEQ